MFEDGHIALRESETGQIQISAPKKPDLVSDKEDELPKIQLKPLDWTKDIQLRSIYRQKAIEKSDSNSQYLHEHPQVLGQIKKEKSLGQELLLLKKYVILIPGT